MKPSIGRQVHYWESGREHAATVIKVHTPETVDLHVLKQDGGTAHVTSISKATPEVESDASNGILKLNGVWTWPKKEA